MNLDCIKVLFEVKFDFFYSEDESFSVHMDFLRIFLHLKKEKKFQFQII